MPRVDPTNAMVLSLKAFVRLPAAPFGTDWQVGCLRDPKSFRAKYLANPQRLLQPTHSGRGCRRADGEIAAPLQLRTCLAYEAVSKRTGFPATPRAPED